MTADTLLRGAPPGLINGVPDIKTWRVFTEFGLRGDQRDQQA